MSVAHLLPRTVCRHFAQSGREWMRTCTCLMISPSSASASSCRKLSFRMLVKTGAQERPQRVSRGGKRLGGRANERSCVSLLCGHVHRWYSPYFCFRMWRRSRATFSPVGRRRQTAWRAGGALQPALCVASLRTKGRPARTLMCSIASPAGASIFSTLNTCGGKVARLASASWCRLTPLVARTREDKPGERRTHLLLQQLRLREHRADHARLQLRRAFTPVRRGEEGRQLLCQTTARTVAVSSRRAFMPAPHSASMRRTYAFTAPFTPSAMAGAGCFLLSRDSALPHQRTRSFTRRSDRHRAVVLQSCLGPEQAQGRQQALVRRQADSAQGRSSRPFARAAVQMSLWDPGAPSSTGRRLGGGRRHCHVT